MCDGGRVAGVVGRLVSREDVVELEVAGAGSQHQETLAGREGTAGEAALVSVALVEHRHRTKPRRRGGEAEVDFKQKIS